MINKKRSLIGLGILIILAGLTAGLLLYIGRAVSPVPLNVRKAVSFPVYYPDPKKLPAGYILNKGSFTNPSNEAVIYSVDYESGKKLVISIQKKPSKDELANFNKRYIPVHRQVLTLVGTATIGSINKQTIASLPADNDSSWIIVTGPAEIYGSDELSQVLKSIKK